MKNNKEELLKLKKVLLVPTIAASLALTGCGSTNNVDNKDAEANNAAESDEETITMTKDELREVINAALEENNNKAIRNEYYKMNDDNAEPVEEKEVSTNDTIENIVETSYSNYQEYCDANGITKNEIRNMVLVLNDEYEGLSQDEVKDACSMIKQTYFPDNLQKKIRTIVDQEQTDIDVNLVGPILRCSEMIYNDECKGIVPILEKIEEYEATVVYSIKETGTFEQIKDGFNNDVVNLYYQNWDVDNGLDYTNVSNEAGIFIVSAANQGLINLATCMNPFTEYIYAESINPTTNEPYKIKIAWNAQEQEIEDKYTKAFIEGNIPDDIQIAYDEIKSRKVISNFVDDACRYEQAVIDSVAEKSNTLEYIK